MVLFIIFEDSITKFLYIKYWKPVGLTCSTASHDSTNIIDRGGFRLLPQRILPIGRLDKNTSGIYGTK